jgi:ribonuclease HI
MGANTAAIFACQDRVMARTRVYTDGACSGNPGPGGWAWIVPDGPFAAGAAAQTTNQRMELTAVLEALGTLEGPLEIISDSTYVVNCFRDRWWEGWLKRDWVNSQRKPVANRDLWEPLVEVYQERDLAFRWVKAHAGDRWNDLADRLAVEATATQESRRGTRTPHEVGPADVPKVRRATSSEDLPNGRFLVVVGHRPPELGGYGETPTSQAVRRRLVDVIAAKRSLHPDLVVLTAMNLGAETHAAEAADEVAVPFIPVLAYPGFDAVWTPDSQETFRRLTNAAERVITLQKNSPQNRQQAGAAAARRDAWLRSHAHEAVAVWTGEDGPIGKQVRSLQDELGEEQVWLIVPSELA